jgi:hypothetical protein
LGASQVKHPKEPKRGITLSTTDETNSPTLVQNIIENVFSRNLLRRNRKERR